VPVGEGWQLFTIRGIPLRIHPSWFVILLLATLAFADQYRSSLNGMAPPQALWPIAFLTALLLFVSVLLHEMGHSLVALSQGVQVRSITLFLLGGVASVERECSTARGALAVAAAGPAVSLSLAALLLSGAHWAAHASPLLGEMVSQLGTLNLVLGLFNLLPGLPLDGGLIVKALVWQVTGSQRRGVEVANTSGRLLSTLAVVLGAWLLLRGAGMGGAWLMLLGWFGLGAARNQNQLLRLQGLLQDLKVRDVAQRRFRVLEADTTLRQLSQIRLQDGDPPSSRPAKADNAAVPTSVSALPDWMLVCERGRWQGVVDDAPLRDLPVQRWDGERVRDHMRPLATLSAIPEGAPLWQAVLQLEEHPRLLVLSPAGLPCGTVEKPEVGEAVLTRLGLRLAPALLAAARRQNTYPLGLALAPVARSMLNSGEVQHPAA
jgi:Zn-dependent protease